MDATSRTKRRAAWLSAGMATAGVAVLAVLVGWQSLPDPWWLWGTLAMAYLSLEFAAVEVNDRLMVSSAIMVDFAAMVIFGPEAGVLAVALMSVGAAFHPRDIRGRRWRISAANLGVLVVSTTAAMLVVRAFLPSGPMEVSDLPWLAVGSALGAVTFDWVGFRLVWFMTRRLYPSQQLRPWSSLLTNHVAIVVLATSGALLGAAYHLVGSVVLPLMAATFAVGQTAFSSYARLREAHLATISGFMKAIEALDRHTKGHTERVARFSEMTASRLGLEAEDLERVRWAALIHDVGKVAVPGELLRRPDTATPEEQVQMIRRMQVVDEVLARVDFLEPIVRIVADSRCEDGRRPDRLEARILAAADAFDLLTATRSYRQAVTQAEAFDALRRRADVLGSDVVEALIAAINERGEVHGLPDSDRVAEAARLVRERSSRA